MASGATHLCLLALHWADCYHLRHLIFPLLFHVSYISTHPPTHIYTQSFLGFFIAAGWLVNLDIREDWVLFTMKCAVTSACHQGLVAQCRAPGAVCTFPKSPLYLMWSLNLVGFCQLHISCWGRVYAYCVLKSFCYHHGSTLLVSTSCWINLGKGSYLTNHWSNKLPLFGVILGSHLEIW